MKAKTVAQSRVSIGNMMQPDQPTSMEEFTEEKS